VTDVEKIRSATSGLVSDEVLVEWCTDQVE
jgi:hypothetical protein